MVNSKDRVRRVRHPVLRTDGPGRPRGVNPGSTAGWGFRYVPFTSIDSRPP